ncbi:MAG: hypothetical protein D3924_03155 [Candidatus Electrothrix sp. AR4]|nr:hypothetical protein [Candidatus Electrothrix sp. AR4]
MKKIEANISFIFSLILLSLLVSCAPTVTRVTSDDISTSMESTLSNGQVLTSLSPKSEIENTDRVNNPKKTRKKRNLQKNLKKRRIEGLV